MMVRILSILPVITGTICAILLLGSLVGINLGDDSSTIDMVPCEVDDSGTCFVAMTPEIDPPTIFGILDINLEISWTENIDSWFAVVESKAGDESVCPPSDSTWLTDCTAEDIEEYIIIGGDEEEDGVINWNVQTDEYRIVTGGREGADIGDKQVLTTNTEISFDWKVEWILFIISVTLFIGAGEMAFPIRKLFRRIREN
ncbi:MAG: hypothetical protein L7S41_01810 [Candidatus Thalassarchaeaceae archaeon]|jgi:hypothetical protein|nr:hypothetical protein [Candidatus Thalassarchaeaceae archaeon]|tara:strand:- start:1061 stop:1660 length:600 start_codon:yes stop_codon:yes gene_type:complete